MKIKAMTMGIIILIVIFGGIGATMVVDLWTTTTDKIPVLIKDGEFAGAYNPADIRGSYTFADVAELFEIDLQVLYEAFGIPVDTIGTEIQTKDLETLYAESETEIGNESVRVFVALYKNLPVDLDETYLPKQAAELILQKNSKLTEEQKNYLSTHSLVVSGTSTSEASVTDESKNETAVVTEKTESIVNGTATFQNILDAGVTKEEIEKTINAPMPPTNQTVKDYCTKAGLSFSEIKEKLNALIE